MAKKQLPKPPEDPRQKVRVYRNGVSLLTEFYIEPGQKLIDIDIYYNLPELDFTVHQNYPAVRVKDA